MGKLDEAAFDATVRAGCTACGSATLEIESFIDRRIVLMLADPNDDGKWVHDGEKFVDGTYRISCPSCSHVAFADDDCPRCHAHDGLKLALTDRSRLTVPKRCPKCNEFELLALALVRASARYGGGITPKPKPLADFGEPGHHIVVFACEACEAATVSQRCPLCDGPGPLRVRP